MLLPASYLNDRWEGESPLLKLVAVLRVLVGAPVHTMPSPNFLFDLDAITPLSCRKRAGETFRVEMALIQANSFCVNIELGQ